MHLIDWRLQGTRVDLRRCRMSDGDRHAHLAHEALLTLAPEISSFSEAGPGPGRWVAWARRRFCFGNGTKRWPVLSRLFRSAV